MNNIIQTIRHTARAAAVLLLALCAAQTAWANDAVTYIDMDGKTKTVTEYTEVTTDMTANGYGYINWSSGTYVVKSSVTLNGCIRFGYPAVIDLIVCDGATLTVNGNSIGAFDGTTLNIYAQSNGTGMGVVNVKKVTACIQLNIAGGKVTLDDDGAGYGLYVLNDDACGLTVNGGDVTIQNSNDSQGAIYFNGQGFVTLNGGKMTVTNSMGNGYKAIEGNSDSNTINFNGGTVVINGKIRDFNNINLNGGNVTVNGEIYKRGGYTVTYDFTRATDSYYINAFSNNLSSSATRTVQVKDGVSFRCNGKSYSGTLSDDDILAISGKRMTPDVSDHFSVNDAGTEYTIHTAKGWGYFCDCLEDNDTYNRFSGKTVKLGADIGTADDPVTRMAGSAYHDFTGTFDGQGHTLTVGYGTADAPFGEQYAAPFRNLEDGCVIKNLHVAGHIYTAAKYAAGLAGDQYGDVTIQNCRSSVTIVSSVENANNDGTHGGFIAYFGGKQKHLSFEGCVFDGKLLTTNGISHCGGFVGWANGVSGTTDTEVTFTNCLYAPAAIADGEDEVGTSESATFARKNNNNITVTLTITNCYYTRALGTAQGKALHSVTAGDDVTLALSGTATEYTVSGITAYEGNQGIKYGTTYYAGSGDEVRLTLSNTATGDVPEGYQYGYTTNAGTIDGSTLTMPAEDVTVSLALRSTGKSVEVTYVDAGGYTVSGQNAIALDGTETDLAAGWYFVGLPTVAFDHTLYLHGNVHLILADGCTMNVTSNADGIDVFGSLTIYGQTEGTGTLNATGDSDGIFTDSGTITISGGRVTATGDYEGIRTNIGNITISGGRVTATGDYEGIHNDSGNITISGGRVTVTGGVAGIFTNGGTITLGCTTASDFIYVSRYVVGSGGTLNIADGQTLFDEDGNYYWGYDVTIPAGKTLQPSVIALTARQAPDGNYWTTYYNGARGFTIDADVNACAYTATYGDGKLTLQKLGKQIPAGTAVIIVADNDEVSMATATDLDDFTGDNNLRGVDYDTWTSDLGTGTFYVLGMTTVGDEQHFGFHRYTGSMMAAHKAFVHVASSPEALARSLTMVFDDATGIESAEADSSLFTLHSSLSTWFTLDGRRLQAKPTAPGIYINNGKKVVIK